MDAETIVGIAVTLLAALSPFAVTRIAARLRAQRRAADEPLRLWRPGAPPPPDTA